MFSLFPIFRPNKKPGTPTRALPRSAREALLLFTTLAKSQARGLKAEVGAQFPISIQFPRIGHPLDFAGHLRARDRPTTRASLCARISGSPFPHDPVQDGRRRPVHPRRPQPIDHGDGLGVGIEIDPPETFPPLPLKLRDPLAPRNRPGSPFYRGGKFRKVSHRDPLRSAAAAPRSAILRQAPERASV